MGSMSFWRNNIPSFVHLSGYDRNSGVMNDPDFAEEFRRARNNGKSRIIVLACLMQQISIVCNQASLKLYMSMSIQYRKEEAKTSQKSDFL